MDGVTGAIVEQVAVQAPGAAPERAERRRVRGRPRPYGRVLADPRLRRTSALPRRPRRPRDLPQRPRRARPPGRAPVRASCSTRDRPRFRRVRDVVTFKGPGTADAALLVSLEQAQALFGQEGRIKSVLVSNRGGDVAGAQLTDEVVTLLRPVGARSASRSSPSSATRSRTRTPRGTRSCRSSRRSARSRSPPASS